MVKTFWIIVLCLFTWKAIAEESAPAKQTAAEKRFFIGVNFAPGITYRTLQQTQRSYYESIVYRSDQKTDRPMFGFDAGFHFDYVFSRLISLEVGLNYSLKGFQSKTDSVYFTPHPPADSIFSARIVQQFHYLDIPMKVKFYAGKRKVKFVGGAGLVFDFLLASTNKGYLYAPSGRQTYENTYTAIPASKAFNVFSMSGTLSAGMDYRINHLMGFRLEPYFSHEFIRLHKEGSLYHYLWSAGLNLAYYFGVK